MSTVKCNSMSLSRSPKLKAHVYEINEVSMDCVHAPSVVTVKNMNRYIVQLAKQLECKTDKNDKSESSGKFQVSVKVQTGDARPSFDPTMGSDTRPIF